MGSLNNKALTSEERVVLLKKLLELLEHGEDRNLRLSKELGVSTPTVRRLRKMLVDERKYNRRKNSNSSRRKKGKRKRESYTR